MGGGNIIDPKIADEGGVENRAVDYDIEVWNNAKMFAQTITKEELIDPKLKLEVILFRLFNELGVYIQSPRLLMINVAVITKKLKLYSVRLIKMS